MRVVLMSLLVIPLALALGCGGKDADSTAPAASDCDEGFGCYSVVDEETPICMPEGAAASGEACSAANDCLAGLVCVADACHDLCDTAATADCSGTEICAVYYDPDGAGYCTE